MKTLNSIKDEMNIISDKINKLYDFQHKLESDYQNVREQMLIDDNFILTENTWTLKCTETFQLYLEDDNDDGFKKLRNLYEIDYHMSLDLFKIYELQFYDGEMRLIADTNEDLLKLISTYNLKVLNKLPNKIKDIDEKLNELQFAKKTILEIMDNL